MKWSTSRLMAVALWCGATPLIVGTAVYGAWRMTRWQWLETAGLWTILVGLGAFLGGASALIVGVVRESRCPQIPPRRFGVQTILACFLLLANFPLAGLYTVSAIDIFTRYTVRVHNRGNYVIHNMVVEGGGARADFGSVAPEELVSRRIRFTCDGRLVFSALQEGVQFDGLVDGYVTGNMSGDTTIVVTDRAHYELQSNKPKPVAPANAE